jgi:hypothetical protein
MYKTTLGMTADKPLIIDLTKVHIELVAIAR